MTRQELLIPRYKVIADFPGCPHEIGHVITTDPEEEEIFSSGEYYGRYPHLFQRLEWWQDREASQMPEYVKTERGVVYKVTEYYPSGDYLRMVIDGTAWAVISNVMCFYEPATATEYEQYKSKQP